MILFGSLAAGDIGSESDIDLVVVERTKKITVLEQSNSFGRHAMREGRVLYEKKG